MFRAIGRFIVASAAGAGLGAIAAIAKGRMGDVGSGGPEARAWTGSAQPEPARSAPPLVPEPAPRYSVAPAEPPSAAVAEAAVPAAPVESAVPTGPEVDQSGDIADLDSARARLRERAAELRAEMERQVGS